jgi:hypothetical protein
LLHVLAQAGERDTMTDPTKALRINTPTADRCTKCGATADGVPCAYPSEHQPGCIWPDGVIRKADTSKAAADALDGIEPSAWASLSPSRKVTYFDGKPMLIAGAAGNEMHDEPLYDRTAILLAIARADERERIIAEIQGGPSVGPQWVCGMIRALGATGAQE